jgi:hypothetical protein
MRGLGEVAAMAKPRKPKRRLVVERSSDNDKRKLREPAPKAEARETLARRARFEGSAKHKLEPRAFGLEPAPSDDDDTYCDGHAGFRPEDMARTGRLLRRGLLAGLIGQIDKQGDPTLIWTVDDNGWVYEGRITTPTRALYHAYPLLPSDAFAKIVIARYAEWAYGEADARVLFALQNALDRYS